MPCISSNKQFTESHFMKVPTLKELIYVLKFFNLIYVNPKMD